MGEKVFWCNVCQKVVKGDKCKCGATTVCVEV